MHLGNSVILSRSSKSMNSGAYTHSQLPSLSFLNCIIQKKNALSEAKPEVPALLHTLHPQRKKRYLSLRETDAQSESQQEAVQWNRGCYINLRDLVSTPALPSHFQRFYSLNQAPLRTCTDDTEHIRGHTSSLPLPFSLVWCIWLGNCHLRRISPIPASFHY